MKKKLFTSAAIGTAGLVALTGAAFAQTDGVDTSETVKDRVAEILGVSGDELDDAFDQARAEHRADRLSERLAEAVEEGVITQQDADTVTAWFEARPEFLDDLEGRGHMGLRPTGDPERYEAALDRLLEDEAITEVEAQEFRDWAESAPTETLELIKPVRDGDRGMRGHMRGEGPGGRMFEGRFEIRPYSPPADNVGEVEDTDVVNDDSAA